MACSPPTPTRSTRTCWPSSRAKAAPGIRVQFEGLEASITLRYNLSAHQIDTLALGGRRQLATQAVLKRQILPRSSVMTTVAERFAEILAAAGIKRVYGIVGDSLNGLTDAIRKQGKIEWLHVRHEEVAAFAAGAEAHLTGELAVCAGSCGPGNLHLINGLYDCHRSRVPVLAIAAQIPSAEIGSGYFQETHPQDLFRECSYYCELISGANQMPRTLEIAIREAVGKRGVAVIVLPGDVALQPATDAPLPKVSSLLLPRPVVIPEKSDLDRLPAPPN